MYRYMRVGGIHDKSSLTEGTDLGSSTLTLLGPDVSGSGDEDSCRTSSRKHDRKHGGPPLTRDFSDVTVLQALPVLRERKLSRREGPPEGPLRGLQGSRGATTLCNGTSSIKYSSALRHKSKKPPKIKKAQIPIVRGWHITENSDLTATGRTADYTTATSLLCCSSPRCKSISCGKLKDVLCTPGG